MRTDAGQSGQDATMQERAPARGSRPPGSPWTVQAILIDVPLEAMGRMSATRANTRASFVADLMTPVLLASVCLRYEKVQALPAVATLLAGLLVFTLVEYVFHRWIFHGSCPVRQFEEGHARHHVDPLGDDALPFFLPPAILVVLAGLFCLAMPAGYALLLAAAVGFGYACYGTGHYIIHSVRFRHPVGRKWAARHHIHHHHPDRNFGVTTPLWDILLGTRYVSKAARKGG